MAGICASPASHPATDSGGLLLQMEESKVQLRCIPTHATLPFGRRLRVNRSALQCDAVQCVQCHFKVAENLGLLIRYSTVPRGYLDMWAAVEKSFQTAVY